jgi:hypothetical protein
MQLHGTHREKEEVDPKNHVTVSPCPVVGHRLFIHLVTIHRPGQISGQRLLSILCLSCPFKGLGSKRRIVLSPFY